MPDYRTIPGDPCDRTEQDYETDEEREMREFVEAEQAEAEMVAAFQAERLTANARMQAAIYSIFPDAEPTHDTRDLSPRDY